METSERYNKVLQYINNQTEENWKDLQNYIISTLDFEQRLQLSKDEDLM